jgi:hypothetical protein
MRAVLWQAAQYHSSERAVLRPMRGGWEIAGTVVAAIEGRPIEAHYVVTCDEQWRTRSTEVTARAGRALQAVCWSVDDAALWWRSGQEVTRVRGCVDVDLALSPSTNTLPIRRLGLRVGDTREVVAAWVRFPDLTIEPLAQRYTRTGEMTYRYESESFAADLEVDDAGLVVHYGDLWERFATADASD